MNESYSDPEYGVITVDAIEGFVPGSAGDGGTAGSMFLPSFMKLSGTLATDAFSLLTSYCADFLPDNAEIRFSCKIDQIPELPEDQFPDPQVLNDAAVDSGLTTAGVIVYLASDPFD